MKKTSIILLINLIIMMFVLSTTSFAEETGNIAGRVRIEKTGAPLAGANVLLEGTSIGKITRKDGSFLLKDVPVGSYTLTVNFIGYKELSKEVEVEANLTTTVMFPMAEEAIGIAGITVTATRAIIRETPIAFTNVSKQQISNAYTTEDVPQLLTGVPGLFSTTAGLGEGELKLRGFDADKVQILINGIPVNDPESQKVYWSNWTGLSSNIKSVQVQRGAGSSLYGSGVFGGSVNIETIGVGADPKQGWTFRTSVGGYYTDNEVADGKGYMVCYNPINYNSLLRYNSGNLKGGRFNYNIMVERKVGDSYQIGTGYDGWSFGAEIQNIWENHKVNTSFIAAPQKHYQAWTSVDMALQDTLGRNYNRTNHEWVENYYCKPQLSIRDEWKLSDKSLILTNFFFTRGDGGGKGIKNDKFDVNTGRIYFQTLSEETDWKYFGRNARWIYENTGVELPGYNAADTTYCYPAYDTLAIYVSKATNIPNGDYSHSWNYDKENSHKQFGFNTYFDHKLNDMISIVTGGELRRWVGVHHERSFSFRYADGVYDKVQDRYWYNGIVTNMSVFGRALVKPINKVNIMVDGQYAIYHSKVEEQPMEIFDFANGNFTGEYYYTSKMNKNEDGSLKYSKDDYKKTYKFFSPKFGVNYNFNDNLNFIANYSIAYKEPQLRDWYSRSKGPDADQVQSDGTIKEIKPEKTNTIEFGAGYEGSFYKISANLYRTDYKDKIETVYMPNGDQLTINAGSAIHQGLELSGKLNIGYIDAMGSLTLSKNRWEKMDVETIFYAPASEVKGKVVPFSPEQMADAAVGYTFENLPIGGRLRIGLSGNTWRRYFGSYTNTYKLIDEKVVSAQLPYYLSINSDITYSFKIAGKDAFIRIDLRNINNRKDNYSKAYYGIDYGRNDALVRKPYMYVTPAPVFNAFLTCEINF